MRFAVQSSPLPPTPRYKVQNNSYTLVSQIVKLDEYSKYVDKAMEWKREQRETIARRSPRASAAGYTLLKHSEERQLSPKGLLGALLLSRAFAAVGTSL